MIDSVGQIRLLTDSRLRNQRQLLTLCDFFSKRSTAVLITENIQDADQALEDLSHGAIVLDRNVPDYGNLRRRLNVTKMRGMTFHGGNHNFRIRTGGLDVYPRLEPEPDGEREAGEAAKSGVKGLDALLGGGLDE